MTRRSAPTAWTDRRRFRLAVKFRIPSGGLGRRSERLDDWLAERVGRGNFAVHPADWSVAMQALAVHLDDAAVVPELVTWLDSELAGNGGVALQGRAVREERGG